MDFEWDPDKEQSNQRKHGISFLEASTVFGDPMELTIYNPDHSEGEYRFLSMGRASSGRLLVVSYTEREENRIRIINARPATAAEMKRYESEN
ncbi:MAG: BrnT family toxin [Gammaproteobacteria bacterium]|nr:BrnT family toxin [Gammaproteobacteria bacterium]MDE0511713.1 BrnT family toxin [Gammaproteobacteria bacterium]